MYKCHEPQKLCRLVTPFYRSEATNKRSSDRTENGKYTNVTNCSFTVFYSIEGMCMDCSFPMEDEQLLNFSA